MERRKPTTERTRRERQGSRPAFAGKLRAPRPLRPARFRLACGVLAAGFLVTTAIGTLREATAVYREPWPPGAGELHLPSLPPPAFPKALGSDGEVKERVRFLLHVVMVPLDFGLEARPRLVREVDVEWPRDRGRVIECQVLTLAGVLSRRLELEAVESGTFSPHISPRTPTVEKPYDWVRVRSSGSAELRSLGSWSRSGGGDLTVEWTDPAQRAGHLLGREEYGWSSGLGRSFASLVPRRLPGRIEFGVLGWRVALEDPLVPGHAGSLPREIPRLRWQSRGFTSMGFEKTFPPGALSYLGHVQWGLVPLLASVFLLTQLFRRRERAFLALLTAAVLLGVAADRYTHGVHLGRLADTSVPAEERALALDSLETTFFYRSSALAAARRVASAAGEPELLRKKADSTVRRLEMR